MLACFAASRQARPAAEALWSVAGPGLARAVGGPAHLADLLANSAHAPLLGHDAAALGPWARLDDAARVRVEVAGADGRAAAYLLSLRRQEGGAEGAAPVWRVTGLVREERADA
ncbi:MAG: hypothetical protein U5K81_04340 [Trueperaceae bacterium]|nr:hypothetical protein [Trueperaceae bacterium]